MKKYSFKFKHLVKQKEIEQDMYIEKVIKLIKKHPDGKRMTIKNRHVVDRVTGIIVDDCLSYNKRISEVIKNNNSKIVNAPLVQKAKPSTFEEEYQNFILELKKKQEEKKNANTQQSLETNKQRR